MARKRIPKKIEEKINEYLKELKKDKLPMKAVFLFGSYAKGTEHKWSDIDLCVVSSRFTNQLKATQYLWLKRTSDSGITIEPIGFSPRDFAEEDSLVHEIKKTGIRVV